MKIRMKPEPNWLNETLALLSLGFDEDPAYPMGFVKDPATYRMSREEIGEKLGQTVPYLKAVYTKTREIVREYKDLEKYFDSNGYGHDTISADGTDRVAMLSSLAFKTALFRHVQLIAMETGAEEEDLDFTCDPNVGNLIAIVTKTNLSDTEKLQILELFQSVDADFPRLQELMGRVEAVLVSHFDLIWDKYEKSVAMYSDNNCEEMERALSRTIEQFGNLPFVDLYVAINIVRLNQLNLIVPYTDRDVCNVSLGIDFVLLSELKDIGAKREEQLLRRLKALADANKLKIIRLISERPMYLKELSEALGITAATASHHMSQLMEEKLIRFEMEGRKIYYSLNASEFRSLAASISEIADIADISEQESGSNSGEGPDRDNPTEREPFIEDSTPEDTKQDKQANQAAKAKH